MKQLDARGLSCPEPVILIRKAMMEGESAYQMMVDDPAARENVTRYAEHQGYAVSVQENNGVYTLEMKK